MALSLIKNTVNLPMGGSVTPGLLLSGLFEVNYGGVLTVNPPTGALDGNVFAIKLVPNPVTALSVAFGATYVSPLAWFIGGPYGIPNTSGVLYDPSGLQKAWTGFFIQDQGLSVLTSITLLDV